MLKADHLQSTHDFPFSRLPRLALPVLLKSSLEVSATGLCPHSIQGGLYANQKYWEAQVPRLTHVPVCPIMAHLSPSAHGLLAVLLPRMEAMQPDLMYSS